MTNDNCHDNTCVDGCCNQYGYCPDDYSSIYYGSDYTTCHYYYNETDMTGGTIAGIIVGVVCFAAIIAIVICVVKKKSQQEAMMMNGKGNGN